MASENVLADILSRLIKKELQLVNTSIEGIIEKVDYEKNTCDVLPMIKTRYKDGKQIPYKTLYDIPLFILSANSGKARITFPIKKGDVVVIVFSQRDNAHFNESDGTKVLNAYSGVSHGMFPAIAIPCIYTEQIATPISDANVIIHNEKSVITITPDGQIDVRNDNGYLTLRTDGEVESNGARITTGGDFITANGVSLDNHIHGGVKAGASNTATPVT